MREAVVVGRPRVGKTRFARELGLYLGGRERQADRLLTARRGESFGSGGPSGPLAPLDVRDRQGRAWLRLYDTAALRDVIPDRVDLRLAMGVTLSRLTQADVVFHVLDAARAGRLGAWRPLPLDEEVRRYGLTRPLYVIIASKIDAARAGEGLRRIRQHFPADPIIPVSLVSRHGLRDVRRLLWRGRRGGA